MTAFRLRCRSPTLLSFGALSVFFRAVARWGWDQFFFHGPLKPLHCRLFALLGLLGVAWNYLLGASIGPRLVLFASWWLLVGVIGQIVYSSYSLCRPPLSAASLEIGGEARK
jgi:hypothetical protein